MFGKARSLARFLSVKARAVPRSYLTGAGRTAAGNLFWLGLFTLLGQACALGVIFLLTDALTRPVFGVVASALTFQSYLLKLGCFGVKQIVVREGARHPDRMATVATSHWLIAGIASSSIGLTATAVVWLTGWGSVDERALLTILAAGNVAACLNIRPLFDVRHQQRKAAGVTFVSELVGLLLVVALHSVGRLTLPLIGATFALKWLLACVGQHLVYHYRLSRFGWSFSPTAVRSMLGSSWPIMLTLLITAVPMTSGVFLVRWLSDEDETAILGLAQQVAMAYVMLLGLCTRILEPHIAGRYGLHRGFIRKLVHFVWTTSLLPLPIAVLVIHLLLRYVINRQFQTALPAIALMLVAAVVVNACRIGSMYLVVLSGERSVFCSNVLAAIVFALLSLCLIPSYGAVGSAAATVSGVAAGAVMILLLASRRVSESQGTQKA